MGARTYLGPAGVRRLAAWARSLVPAKTSDLENDSGFVSDAGVTGAKGAAEASYRAGLVSISKADVGLGSAEDKSSAQIRAELTAEDVARALGFSPAAYRTVGDLPTGQER